MSHFSDQLSLCISYDGSLRKQISCHFTFNISPLFVKRWINWSIIL